jgi:hypothetical protein
MILDMANDRTKQLGRCRRIIGCRAVGSVMRLGSVIDYFLYRVESFLQRLVSLNEPENMMVDDEGAGDDASMRRRHEHQEGRWLRIDAFLGEWASD